MFNKFFALLLLVLLAGCSSNNSNKIISPIQISNIIPDLPKAQKVQTKFDKARLHYEAGIKEDNNNQTEKAISEFLEAIKIEPEYFDSLYALGKIYSKNGNRDKSLEVFKKAIEIKYEDPSIHNEIGDVYKEMNKLDEAIQEYDIALKLDPSFTLTYYNLGLMYNTRKYMLDKAIRYYQQAIDLNNNLRISSMSHYQLGVIYYSKGQEQNAVNQFKMSIDKFSDYAPPHFNLGEIYAQQQKIDKALSEFESYIRLNTNTKNDKVEEARKYIRKLRNK